MFGGGFVSKLWVGRIGVLKSIWALKNVTIVLISKNNPKYHIIVYNNDALFSVVKRLEPMKKSLVQNNAYEENCIHVKVLIITPVITSYSSGNNNLSFKML